MYTIVCETCGKRRKVYYNWQKNCEDCEKLLVAENKAKKIRAGEKYVSTWSKDYVICPHCGCLIEADLGPCDFPELYIEGDHDLDCPECGKMFILESRCEWSYETRKAGRQ